MTDLVAFLRARLDEDEDAALAAAATSAEHWWIDTSEDKDERSVKWTGPSTLNPPGQADYWLADRLEIPEAQHIVRWDPARVLRWVKAARAALDSGAQGGLAAIYSDHPDYRDEWKPGASQEGG